MQALTLDQCRTVAGGECGATGMCGSDGGGYGGDNAPNDSVGCANAMAAWGGFAGSIGGTLGGAFGGLFGGFMAGFGAIAGGLGGMLGGAAAAAAFSDACNSNNTY